MRNLRDIRGLLPSPSLVLHYATIALFMTAIGAGSVYYFHVEKAMAVVGGNAEQIASTAVRIKDEVSVRPETEAKLVRLQAKADQIQNTAQSVVPTSTIVN